MTATSRIDELRRRIREDPASIAFAQLGEELRRAGRYAEAVEICRVGLTTYPTYVAARVSLARALTGLNRFDDAERELRDVLSAAPDNQPAVRALADVQKRRDNAAFTTSPSTASGHETQPSANADASTPTSKHPTRRIDEADYVRVLRTLSSLEAWLDAIHVTRTSRHA
jgi:predicted Zn-dependent protease